MGLRGRELTTRGRPLARRALGVLEQECAAQWRRAPIDRSAVLFESFAGSGVLCNPEAIFRALLAAPDLSHLRFVWALAPNVATDARVEFADNPRVRFVTRRSVAYYRELGRAKYLVNNATFPVAFAKRAGQVYLGTWHGTPLKAMGYDMPHGAVESANVVRNLLAADYLLAPNEQTASMYLDSYRLRHAFRGTLLNEGTPRIDRQFVPDSERQRTVSRLRREGVLLPDGARVVVYAPTWRGSFASPDDNLDVVCRDVAATRAQLAPGTVLLIKIHQRVYEAAADDPRLSGALIPNDVPTNDVLAITDVLVSDYSSIMVDFLAADRPIVRFVPDLDAYEAGRGLTVGVPGLPGPVCHTVTELAGVLKTDLSGESLTPAYVQAREIFCSRENGHATQRVVDAVFRSPVSAQRGGNDRRSMLIYLGGMRTNGITSSALSLLRHLDYDRLDVTVTFPAPHSPQTRRHAEMIDGRARVLPRLGRTSWTQIRATPFPYVGGRTPFIEEQFLYERRMHDEWRRCFGDTRFDHVINFGGYSAFFAKLLRCAPTGMVATWLHNDMRAEMTNPGRGPWLRANVRRTASMYYTSDSLVSVSPELDQVNLRGGGRWAPARLFTAARNTVDAARICLASGLHAGAARRPAADAERRTFVTVGRLTAAKNHTRLLHAFAQVRRDEPDIRLTIIGAGPLGAELRALASALGIDDAVTFTGSTANPYPVMAAADCFVLSSDYEGQPVVLLEALVLGLPIVTTDFAAVSGALPAGSGLVVRRDVAALAEGMRAFLSGEVQAVPFDASAYNTEAMGEFYRAVGVPDRTRPNPSRALPGTGCSHQPGQARRPC